MESKSRTWEEIEIGLADGFQVKITENMIQDFAELSGDKNPLHVASGVAHGMLLASLFSRFVGMYVPGKHSLYLSQTLNFKHKVYAGDSVRVQGEVVAKSEATKLITIKTTLTKSNGEIALEGEAKVMYV